MAIVHEPEPRRTTGAQRPRRRAAKPVTLASTLDDIESFYLRYIQFGNRPQITAAIMWAAQSHVIPAADHLLHLNIYSPVKRCGKNHLAAVIGAIALNPLSVAMVTAPALYHDMQGRTLFIDEYHDTLAKGNGAGQDMLTLIKVSAQRGQMIPRYNMESRAQELFDPFAPMCLIGINPLPNDQVQDRCIPLALQRKKPGEIVTRWHDKQVQQEGKSLRERLSQLLAPHILALATADPYVTAAIDANDRATENGRLIFAIADLAGGAWAERVREDIGILLGDRDTDSLGESLLRDIRTVLADDTKISTHDLMRRLVNHPDNQEWANRWDRLISYSSAHDMRRAEMQFSDILRPFGIKPKPIWLDGKTLRGFDRATLTDAFARYLPAQKGI